MPVDLTLCSWGLLRGGVKERKVEFTEEDTGPCGIAFHCHSGKMPEGLGNGCPLGANTDSLVLHDKWGSFIKENTALLKSTHIEEATRKPKERYWKCLARGIWASFCLFWRVFLIFHSIFLWLLGPNCLEAYNKGSVANHLASKSEPAVFRIN